MHEYVRMHTDAYECMTDEDIAKSIYIYILYIIYILCISYTSDMEIYA